MSKINPDIKDQIDKVIYDLKLETKSMPSEPIECFGQTVPESFAYFCKTITSHNGWPHVDYWPGIYSPFGDPSPMTKRNRELRGDSDWPQNLVCFSETDDGAYCFDYENNTAEPPVIYEDSDTPFGHFGDWLANQAEWLKEISGNQ